MKHLWKILAIVALVFALVFVLASCGDKPTDNPSGNNGNTSGDNGNTTGGNDSGNGSGNNSGNQGGSSLLTIDVSGVRFGGKYYVKQGMGTVTKTYNGQNQTLENYTGNPSEERATETFTYWNADDTAQVAGSEGVSEPGTYVVHLTFSYPGYADATVKAKLIINQSYAITYVGPNGMNTGNNPQNYSLSDDKLLYEATAAKQKFKGWYTTADYQENSLITSIDGSTLTGVGDLTLYAKFQPYVDYPANYYESVMLVSENGGVVPAIPGYENLDDSAVAIIDLNQNLEDANANGFAYNSKDVTLLPKYEKNKAVLTAGGQAVLEWQEYGDGITDEEHLKTTRNQFQFKTISYPANYQDYTTVEFWVYSEKPTYDVFTCMFLTNNVNNQAFTFDITLDFTGWKKITITRDTDAYSPAGSTMLIHEIRLMAVPYSGLRSDKATLGFRNASDNKVYFSSIYLTTNRTSMEYLSNSLTNVVVSAFEKLGLASTNALLTDVQAAPYLDDNFSFSGSSISSIFETTYKLATVWNDSASSYYHNSTLLKFIATTINSNIKKFTDDNKAGVADAGASLNLVRTVAIISDYVSSDHGKIWMKAVDNYYPTAGNSCSEKFNSGLISLLSGLCQGNASKVNSSIKAIASVFESDGITVLDDLSLFTDYINVLVSTMDTQLYDGNKTDYVNNLFAWFTKCVDAFTYNGSLPTIAGVQNNFISAVQGMIMLYPYASEESQNTFASQVKYYLSCNSALEGALTASLYKDVATNLATVKANTTAAKTADGTACYVYEGAKKALIKTATVYVIVKEDSFYVGNGEITGSADISEITSFYGLANTSGFALVINGNISVTANVETGAVVVSNQSQGIETSNGGLYVFVKVADELAGKLVSVASNPMIVSVEATGSKYDVTVYNFTKVFGSAVEIYFEEKVGLDQVYDEITSTFDNDLELTVVTIADTNKTVKVSFTLVKK